MLFFLFFHFFFIFDGIFATSIPRGGILTYWEPYRLEDANSKEVIVSILGELSLTTALQ